MILVVAAAVGYGLLAHRVDQSSLSYSIATNGSLDAHARRSLAASCQHSRGADWTCSLETVQRGDGGIVYLMRIRGDCWTARLSANFSGLALPGHADGCVGILDQFRIADRLDAALGSGVRAHGFY